MDEKDISKILEKLHQTEGIPRLEIEGCKYPINEKLIEDYKKTYIPIPERNGIFVTISFSS